MLHACKKQRENYSVDFSQIWQKHSLGGQKGKVKLGVFIKYLWAPQSKSSTFSYILLSCSKTVL